MEMHKELVNEPKKSVIELRVLFRFLHLFLNLATASRDD